MKADRNRSQVNGMESDIAQAEVWLDLSHELRTPIHAILGNLELILSGSAGPLPSGVRAGLGDIQQSAITLSARIGDVITMIESTSHHKAEMTDQAQSTRRRN